MNATKFEAGVTRLRSTHGSEVGTFQGWDEDGEALILWDGYDDVDGTLAYAVVETLYTAYTFDADSQRVPLGEHLTGAEVNAMRRVRAGVVVDEEN